MKSIRWKKLLRLNKKMLRYEINKLSKTTNFETHVVQGSYSISASSVNVSVVPKDQRWIQ